MFINNLKTVSAILFIVLAVNFAVWAGVNQSVSEKAWGGTINSVSYNGYTTSNDKDKLSEKKIDSDLAVLADNVFAVRTYSVSDNLEKIPSIAQKHNLEVILGVWLSKDKEKNYQEIQKAIQLVKTHDNITRLMIGNETLLRDDLNKEHLIQYIELARKQVDIPVSTAEPWHVWLDNPDIAQSVDFITIHLLPYWEGQPIDNALNYAMMRYKEVSDKFPNKHIFIGEIGWPSDGQWAKGAEPSLINQARFIRDFLNLASAERLDYSIIESFDAPWKRSIEGSVGGHWGLWNTNKLPKFSMSGSITESSRWFLGYCLASLLAAFPIVFFLMRNQNITFRGKLFYSILIQAAASVFIWAIMAAIAQQVLGSNLAAWIILLIAHIILLALLMVDGYEFTEVLWSKKQKRQFNPYRNWKPDSDAPLVSIHVPCYNEPPEMLFETLDALAKMDYPNFEVLVIDNNTKDESVWKPVENYCEKLGAPFRFFHVPSLPGFKAGALNFALSHTDEKAEFIAVIDSDYKVSPDWLKASVPFFQNESVGFVQSPQDYRDEKESLFKKMCFWEYAGFFHIGMVQRNEQNAIIQHGTMTIIRKSALISVNGWSEWCICEDAELGLKLLEKGYESVYLKHSFGKGLIPDNFSAYKNQRFRWAYGAMQIVKRHRRFLLTDDKQYLTPQQKYYFISGWTPWFADAANLVFVIAAILWSVLLLFRQVEFPPAVFLVPTLSVFFFKIVSSFMLYQARLSCGWKDRIRAAIAGMSLSYSVSKAVWLGMFTSDKPFLRTPKCREKAPVLRALLMAKGEAVILLTLVVCALLILWKFEVQNRSAALWAGMLMVQTLPFISAVILANVNAFGKKQK